MKVDMNDVQEDFKRYQGEIDDLKMALQGVLTELMGYTNEKAGECTGWAGEAEDLLKADS